MAGLPWFKVFSNIVGHPKTRALEEATGNAEALAYIVRLLSWFNEYAPSGRADGARTARAVERACEWRGETGVLLAALESCGWLDRDGSDLCLHDWDDVQGSHITKAAKDADAKKLKRLQAKQAKLAALSALDRRQNGAETARAENADGAGAARVEESREEENREKITSSPAAIAEAAKAIESGGVYPAKQTALPGTEQPDNVPKKPTTAAAEFAGWARETARPLLAPDAPDSSKLKAHQWAKLGDALKAHGALKMQAAFRLYTGDPYWLGRGLPLGAFVADWEKWVAQVAAPKPPATSQRQTAKTSGMDFAELKRRAAEVAEHEAREAAKAKEAHNGVPAGS